MSSLLTLGNATKPCGTGLQGTGNHRLRRIAETKAVRGKIRALEFLDEQLHLPEGAIAS